MPKNEVVTKEKNEVALTGGLALQTKLLEELDKANQDFGADFTPYGKTCAINAIAGLVMFCKQNDIDLKDVDPTMLRLQVQNVGFTELNYASIPSEVYFDLRKQNVWAYEYNEETGKKEKVEKATYSVSIKPQGAGNEKLVRKYGVGLKKGTGLHNAILIREGDEYQMPQFNGITVTPFIYKPKLENANNKVIAVCYPVEKEDGAVEYLIATRDSVKANLIAQIRQNAMYADEFFNEEEYTGKDGKKHKKKKLNKELRDTFYARVNEIAQGITVDEMLDNPELLPYINPTYTSGGSKEAMIMRKMKNNALKNYPKEYDNSYISNAVRDMFEENDRTVLEKKNAIDAVEYDLDEDLNDDVIDDFDAKETQVDDKVDGDNNQKVDNEDDIPF